ncbi:MAG TPA: DNA polymerase III subunit delta [Bacillota bacterium]|nr:DNA polymerase III subunit delta [Bacillota bacterium]
MNPNCILIHGNDNYAIKKNIEEILGISEILEEDTEYYDYEEEGLEGALQSAMTLPFLSEKKAVILKNCSFLTEQGSISSEASEALKNYCSFVNPTTIFMMTSNNEKLDLRKNLVKHLTKNIETRTCNSKANTDSIYKYIQTEVERNGLTIDYLALTQFVNRIGNDSDILENELAKLITYALDKKRITSDMVYDIVSRDLESNIYELVNAYLAKDLSKAMEIYNDLKSLKIDPIWMLSAITNKFQEILYTKELLKMKYKNEDIMKYFNASKGRVYYMVQNARNVEDDQLMKLLSRSENLDYQIKSGQIEKDLGIELFLLEME